MYGVHRHQRNKKIILSKYYKQQYINKIDNMKEMDKSLQHIIFQGSIKKKQKI